MMIPNSMRFFPETTTRGLLPGQGLRDLRLGGAAPASGRSVQPCRLLHDSSPTFPTSALGTPAWTLAKARICVRIGGSTGRPLPP